MNEENNQSNIIETEVTETEIKDPEVKQPKKKRFFNKQIVAMVLCTTILSSSLGFAGGYLAMSLNNKNGNQSKEVFYQSVVQTNADGSEVNGMSVSDVVANVKESIVEITTSTMMNNNPFIQNYVSSGAGSGVIVSDDGTIITNAHVVDGASSIKVRLADGSEYDATVLGSDAQTDVAVIKIEAKNLKPAIFGDSDQLIVGETAIAIGNPLGSLGGTVTTGIISALDREISIDGQSMRLLQTNAAINPGNSGGGLFNASGELVGIVNAKSSGTDIEGLGFAIPINVAKVVAEQLISNGEVSGRMKLGITYVEIDSLNAAMQNGVNTLGLLVKEVSENSNASRAGVLANDMIIAADGEQISTSAELKLKLQSHEFGDTMTLTVIRDRKYVDLSVILAE